LEKPKMSNRTNPKKCLIVVAALLAGTKATSYDRSSTRERKGIITSAVVIIGAAVFALATPAWSQTSEWAVYNTANSGLPYNGVTSLAIDEQGNTWIGTGIFGGYTGGGLAMFDGQNWKVYNTANSALPHNDLPVLTIDTHGNLWIGTDGGGLAKFDGVNWTVYRTGNSGMPDNRVYGLPFDTQGNLWIATFGLAKFDGTSWTAYNTANSGLPSNLVTSVVIDAQQNKWIGSWDRSVARVSPLIRVEQINPASK
jgi:ligand-binding sensor domain-containing protein